MLAPDGYEHLGEHFWSRVEPDPDSSCLIFQTESLHPSYRGKTLLAYLLGPGRPSDRHRACYRSKCVNPDHVVPGSYIPGQVYAPRARSRSQFDRQYAQC